MCQSLKAGRRKQINSLGGIDITKEINDLFDSFAGEYFKKLYGYGMVGAVFGINLWIPIIWAIIEYIREKKNLN